jgi:hypothetical protein
MKLNFRDETSYEISLTEGSLLLFIIIYIGTMRHEDQQ